MLLLRTYHETDLLTLQTLTQTHDAAELSKLKSLLASNYSLVCEILGNIVGFAIFFSDQSHIALIHAQEHQQHEILTVLLQRIETKALDSAIKHITIDANAPYQYFWQQQRFTPSSSKHTLVKKLS